MVMTVFLGCLVGVVVVAQTLYTSTMEHIKEFATVKAIGGGNAEIYAIIAKQAAIAAVVGFALGSAMAYGLRPIMAGVDLKLILTPSFAVCLRRDAGTLPRGLGDLVPEGGGARPGPGLPRADQGSERLLRRSAARVAHEAGISVRSVDGSCWKATTCQGVPRGLGDGLGLQRGPSSRSTAARSWPWRDLRARARRPS